MDQFEAIRMFVRVVDSGSFSAVAREAGIGQPAVSKQIAALEVRLGAQLLRRTSRSLSVTEAGQDFYESAVRLVDDLETAVSRIGRGQTAPSGLIRVAVAPVFGRVHLLPRLGEFFARWAWPIPLAGYSPARSHRVTYAASCGSTRGTRSRSARSIPEAGGSPRRFASSSTSWPRSSQRSRALPSIREAESDARPDRPCPGT